MAGINGGTVSLFKRTAEGPDVYELVACQQGLSLNRGTNTFDTSCKDETHESHGVGKRNWSMSLSGLVAVGDTSQDQLDQNIEDGEQVMIETNGRPWGDVRGLATIEGLDEEFGDDDAVSYSASLKGSGELVAV